MTLISSHERTSGLWVFLGRTTKKKGLEYELCTTDRELEARAMSWQHEQDLSGVWCGLYTHLVRLEQVVAVECGSFRQGKSYLSTHREKRIP